MNIFILSAVTFIPAVLLCFYVYVKDRAEKEPIWLLLLLFFMGAVVYMPAYYCENLLVCVVDKAFVPYIEFSLTGVAQYVSGTAHAAHMLSINFIAIALVEELFKWLVLFLITFKNKNFNSLFDGVVYSVFVAVGFAFIENIRYGIVDGWDFFILRTVTNLPTQVAFSVVMGCFYTLWHTYKLAKKREKKLIASGVVENKKPFVSAPFIVLSFLAPVLLHGVYTFVRDFSSSLIAVVLFYAFIVLLYVVCFVLIHKLSAADSTDEKTVMRLIRKKYPHVEDFDAET